MPGRRVPAAGSKPRRRGSRIPEELPAEVLDDVASVVGAEVTLLGRLPGGANEGAIRVQLAGTAPAVLKAGPRAHPRHLDETLRAQRVAGQASEPYDHWSYAWRVATGQETAVAGLDVSETPEQSFLRQSVARLPGYSPEVAALAGRLRLVSAGVPPPPAAPDMVHTDLNPGNVLVREGAVVAVVDIGNAGSGTRATDLTNLVWNSFTDPLDRVRRRLWTRILVLVGWEGAAMLAAAQILHMLEVPVRHGHHDAVPGVVERGHRALDELTALR